VPTTDNPGEHRQDIDPEHSDGAGSAKIGPGGDRRPRVPPDGEWEIANPDDPKIRASADGAVLGTSEDAKRGLEPLQSGGHTRGSDVIGDVDEHGRAERSSDAPVASPFKAAEQYAEPVENLPHPWPADPITGLPIRQHDLEFLGLTREQVEWWMNREAPLGMTPGVYREWRLSMLEALARDGVSLDSVDIRMRGSGADFYSGVHKKLPTDAELADNPESSARLRSWLGADDRRPEARPFDAMYKLGIEEPSDFDLNISSDEMFQRARENWDPDQYIGTLTKDHGYLNKGLVLSEFPHLFRWAQEWGARTGREMSYAVFDSDGPKDVSHLGYFVHFRESDWIVHRPLDTHPETPSSETVEGIRDREHGMSVDRSAEGERQWSRQLGYDIVTDHGTVTKSEVAKTMVIRSVTDEMTSSTEQLMKAGAGAFVDPNAVGHLGDPDHVIVLRNREYPSMGGELLHRSELDQNDPRHAESGLLPLDSPHAEHVLREMAVSEMIMAWAHDSNGTNVRSLAIQEAAIHEFGLNRFRDWAMSDETRGAVDGAVRQHGAVHRELLRVQFEKTQQELARMGVNDIVLYRGYSWPEEIRPDWSLADEGSEMPMPLQRPLSSWASDRQVAADWLVRSQDPGVILAARFPREQVLAFPRTGIGCLWQYEFVVLAGHGSVTLDIRHEVGGS
jgi:hypothetical protein